MKKLLTGAISISLLLSPALPAFAQDATDGEAIEATSHRGNFRVMRRSRRLVTRNARKRIEQDRTRNEGRRSRVGRRVRNAERKVHNRLGDTNDTSCILTAVSAREDAIMAAWDMFHTSMMEVLEMRKSDLETAWAIGDSTDRRVALQKAWSMFKEGKKETSMDARQARRMAWKNYKMAARACGISTTEEIGGETADDEL